MTPIKTTIRHLDRKLETLPAELLDQGHLLAVSLNVVALNPRQKDGLACRALEKNLDKFEQLLRALENA